MNHFTLLIAILLIICSCIETPITKKTSNTITVLKCDNKNQDANDKFKNYRIIDVVKLETSAKCFLNNIQQIVYIDSLYIILDYSNKLFVFDQEGCFKTQIGSRGEGPDQYSVLASFYMNEKNNIVIIDDFKASLKEYSLDGRFISTTPIALDYFQYCRQSLLIKDSLLVLYNLINWKENMAYSLLNIKEKQLIGRYFPYNITTNHFLYSFAKHPMATSENTIDLILPLCDTIYSYEDLTFYPKYIVEHPFKTANRNLISPKTKSYTNDVYELSKKGFFTGFTSIYETSKYLLLEYKDKGIMFGFFLFNKESKHGNNYLYATPNELTEIPFTSVLGSTEDYFISSIKSDILFKTQLKIEPKKDIDIKFKKLIKQTKEDDNPFLIIYEIIEEEQ